MEILSIPSLYKVDQTSRTPGEKKKRERTREMTVKPLLTYFLQKGK